jgi:regulator of sirC expression with transglutaminase-like and TPR domain
LNLSDLIRSHITDPNVGIGQLALECALFEYPDLDINEEVLSFQSLSKAIEGRVSECETALAKVNTLSEYLFDEVEFRGNTDNYYDPRNSFINDVLDRRLGIPISLSIVYVEVASRLGLECVPIGAPGHLILKINIEDGTTYFIDPFNKGIVMSEPESIEFFQRKVGLSYDLDQLTFDPINKHDLILRLFTNIKYIYLRNSDYEKAYKVLDLLVDIDPHNVFEQRDRGIVGLRVGMQEQSLRDFRSFLKIHPVGRSAVEISGFIEMLEKTIE